MSANQYQLTCKVYLHPSTCTRPAIIDAFQRRTGLQIVVSSNGHAQAVPNGGAA